MKGEGAADLAGLYSNAPGIDKSEHSEYGNGGIGSEYESRQKVLMFGRQQSCFLYGRHCCHVVRTVMLHFSHEVLAYVVQSVAFVLPGAIKLFLTRLPY